MLKLALLSVFLGSVGQVFVKIGARYLNLNFSNVHQFIKSFFSILKNGPVMIGMILYGVSFLLWVKVLSKTELSYAYPLVSLGYIMIVLFSYFYFKEEISLYRGIGVFLIIGGVILVARS